MMSALPTLGYGQGGGGGGGGGGGEQISLFVRLAPLSDLWFGHLRIQINARQ